jgi:hypothetical protein
MVCNLIIAATAIGVGVWLVVGVSADRRISRAEQPTVEQPDIATQVAHEDGYARPPAVVPVHRRRGAHARGRRAA